MHGHAVLHWRWDLFTLFDIMVHSTGEITDRIKAYALVHLSASLVYQDNIKRKKLYVFVKCKYIYLQGCWAIPIRRWSLISFQKSYDVLV